MGSGLYFCLFNRNAFILYQFYVVSRYASGQNERATPQIRPRSHLSSHSGHIHTLHITRFASGRRLGLGYFRLRLAVGYRRFHFEFQKLKEHSNLETCCYVAMGASILVAMKPLMDHLALLNATPAFWWLIGGGVSYITGAVFYSLRKPYMHATFHLFCLGGSIGHIIAIWLIL